MQLRFPDNTTATALAEPSLRVFGDSGVNRRHHMLVVS